MIIWNPWHGCHKVSEGCEHCYMYFLDSKRGLDTSHVFRTENFTLPIQRRRDRQFKLPSGMTLYVGLSTDFFVEEADQWRDEAWRIIRQRPSYSIVYDAEDLTQFFTELNITEENGIPYLKALFKGKKPICERVLKLDAERYEKGDLPLANLLSKYCSYIAASNRDL